MARRPIPGFDARLAEWEAEVRPQTPAAKLAVRRIVAATFRIEACRVAFRDAIGRHMVRAEHAWDEDRFAEAAALLGRLGRQPEVVAHQLRTSAHGVALLIRLWERLAEALDASEGWNEPEVATACDLLGIPVLLRSGRLPFDPRGADGDVREARRTFVRTEIQRLQARLEGPMAKVDATDHDIAVRGTLAMLTRPVQLILRYEAAANRVFDRMYALARSTSDPEPAASATPEPGAQRPDIRIDPRKAGLSESRTRTEAILRQGLAPGRPAEAAKPPTAPPPARPAGIRVDRPLAPAPKAEAVAAERTPARPEPTVHLNRHQRRARAARARAAGSADLAGSSRPG